MGEDLIPEGTEIRASHLLIKHAESRNPVSRRTNESTSSLTKDDAEKEIRKWLESLEADERPLAEKFAALAWHRARIHSTRVHPFFSQPSLVCTGSDCGSFQSGGDLGKFKTGEMQPSFEAVAWKTAVGEVSQPFQSDSGCHVVFRTE